ncbi:MAG TPA: DUF4142 domain-containing protein [Archangium sp.]|uniref:DUF4142 domain-containing protein n=1 Tax=Archangium sp. TaxID=1872627 RepID=UPI002E34AC94|nr:DUF4142 domain-containing protein [Archangium sp.]HEX5752260.1 DUF4142 domain-containing protein [Archangium sp.]
MARSKALSLALVKYDKQVERFYEKRDELAGLSGREFDKAFLEQVSDDQDRGKELIEEGLDEYRDDTTLAVFLGRTAPVLSGHLRRVKSPALPPRTHTRPLLPLPGFKI